MCNDKNCLYCSKPLNSSDTRQIFCKGTNCKAYYHREKNRKALLEQTCCYYCAAPIDPNKIGPNGVDRSRARKFCSDEHNTMFHNKKKCNKPVPLRISPKLLIFSRHYDRIPEIVMMFKRNAKDINGNADLVTSRYVKKPAAQEHIPKEKTLNPYVIQ